MKNNKKIIIALIAFAIVLTLTIASTYAYFTASATSRGNAQQVNVKTAQLGITYTHGTKVETGSSSDATNIHDNWDTFLGIDVTSTGTIEQYFDIIWDTVTTNTIVGNHNGIDTRSDFTWTLYEIDSTYNGTDVASSNEIIASGTNKETGYLYGTESGDIILNNESIGALATKHYVLHIHFNYDEERNQDYQQGKEFSGTIKVRIHEEIARVIGSSEDWTVSNEPNEDGGYTLISYNHNLDDCTGTSCPQVTVHEDYFDNTSNIQDNTIELLQNIRQIDCGESTIEECKTTYSNSLTNTNAYEIVIPSMIDDKEITAVGSDLLKGINFQDQTLNEDRTRLINITLSEGIERIESTYLEGEEPGGPLISTPFLALSNLYTINLPSTLNYIGEGTFLYTSISSIVIPGTVSIIQPNTFLGAIISDLTLSEGITNIEAKAFLSSKIYGDFVIPSSVQRIEEWAFVGGLNYIDSLTFAGTSTDGSGNDTSSLTYLGEDCMEQIFSNKQTKTDVYLPSTILEYNDPFVMFDNKVNAYVNTTSNVSWATYKLDGTGGYILNS